MTLTIECDEKEVETIEGLGDPKTSSLDPLQQAFIDDTAFQCGYCTPGRIMSAKALLKENPQPTEDEVKEAVRQFLPMYQPLPGGQRRHGSIRKDEVK